MASKIKVDQIEGSSGSSITIPSGQTLTITDGLAASTIGSGTLADARIPDLNASKITAGTIATARLGSGTANNTTFLRGDQTFAAVAGGGKLLQVVQGESTTEQSISTGSSFTDITNLNAAITPAATSSKIFIIVSVHGDQQTGDRGFGIQLNRSISGGASTNIYTDVGVKGFYHSSGRMQGKYPHFELDSPNTTSAITYKVQAKTDGNNACIFNGQGISSITLMEIGV